MQNGNISNGSVRFFNPIIIGFIICLLVGYTPRERVPLIIGFTLKVWTGFGRVLPFIRMFFLHCPEACGCGMILLELNPNGFTTLKNKRGLV